MFTVYYPLAKEGIKEGRRVVQGALVGKQLTSKPSEGASFGLERRARNVTPSLGQYLGGRTAPATGDTLAWTRRGPNDRTRSALRPPSAPGCIEGDSGASSVDWCSN